MVSKYVIVNPAAPVEQVIQQQPQQQQEGTKKEGDKETEEKETVKVKRDKEVPEEVKFQDDVKKKEIHIIEKTAGDLVEPEHQP